MCSFPPPPVLNYVSILSYSSCTVAKRLDNSVSCCVVLCNAVPKGEADTNRDRLMQNGPYHPCGTRQNCIRHHLTQRLRRSSKLYTHARASASRPSVVLLSFHTASPHDMVYTAVVPTPLQGLPIWIWGIKFQSHPRSRLKAHLDEGLSSLEAVSQPYLLTDMFRLGKTPTTQAGLWKTLAKSMYLANVTTIWECMNAK